MTTVAEPSWTLLGRLFSDDDALNMGLGDTLLFKCFSSQVTSGRRALRLFLYAGIKCLYPYMQNATLKVGCEAGGWLNVAFVCAKIGTEREGERDEMIDLSFCVKRRVLLLSLCRCN